MCIRDRYSTKGAITVGIEDIIVPPEKQQLIEETDKLVDKIVKQYRRGLITEEERYNNVIKAWTETIEKLTAILKKNKMCIRDRSGPVAVDLRNARAC